MSPEYEQIRASLTPRQRVILPHLTARQHPQVREEIDYYFRVIREIPAVNRPAAVSALLRFFLPTFQHLVRALGPRDLVRGEYAYRGQPGAHLVPPGQREPFRRWQTRVNEAATQIVDWLEMRGAGQTTFPAAEVEDARAYIQGLSSTIPTETGDEALRRLAFAYGIGARLVPIARTRWTLGDLDLIGTHLAMAAQMLPDPGVARQNLGQLLLAFVPFRGRVSGRGASSWIETTDGPYEIGPQPELAQTWSPPWLARAFWQGVRDSGWDPRGRPLMAELAAGSGRLIEPMADAADWILNDIDPRLASELRERYPSADVRCGDFRQLTGIGPVDAAIGAPPWIDDDHGVYLPQAYAEVCAAIVRPGGLVGLIVPESFEPDIDLRPLHEGEIDPERLRRWPFTNRPALLYYQR